MGSALNYKKYRETFAELEKQIRPGPCIPFIGLFLRDLTFLNDGNPKKFKSGLYNFAKLRMISDRIFRMQVYQQTSYSFPVTKQSEPVREYLKNLSPMTDENALYKCSLLSEPREGDLTSSNLSLNEIPGDASGTPEKDSGTLKKLRRMSSAGK